MKGIGTIAEAQRKAVILAPKKAPDDLERLLGAALHTRTGYGHVHGSRGECEQALDTGGDDDLQRLVGAALGLRQHGHGPLTLPHGNA